MTKKCALKLISNWVPDEKKRKNAFAVYNIPLTIPFGPFFAYERSRHVIASAPRLPIVWVLDEGKRTTCFRDTAVTYEKGFTALTRTSSGLSNMMSYILTWFYLVFFYIVFEFFFFSREHERLNKPIDSEIF